MPTTTGFKTPATIVSGTGGVFAWANPSNAGAEDGAYAEAAVAGATTLLSAPLRATNFGFALGDVPANSHILGIEVIVKRAAVGGTVRDASLKLYRNGVLGAIDKAFTGTDWPGSLTNSSAYGTTTSLWGLTVRDTDLRASTFGLELSVYAFCPAPGGSGDLIYARVDSISMRATYDAGTAEMPERATWHFFGRLVGLGWAPRYRYATEYTDVDVLARPYAGRLVDAPVVTRETVGDTAVGSGVVQQSATLKLRNQDGALTPDFLLGMRGWTTTLHHYDVGLDEVRSAFTGRVQQDALDEDGTVSLTAADFRRTLLDRQIPSVMVDPSIFPNAVTVGVPVPVAFGVATIPMPYICDGVGGTYDYLVGHGVVTVSAIRKVLEGGKDKTPSTVTVAPSAYTVSTSHYAGYTTIRFAARQTGSGGGTATLMADVIGPLATRTFPGAIEAVLTAAWGAAQTVDADSFAAAQATISAASHAQLVCAGAMTAQRAARDVLQDLLRPYAMRLSLTAAGAWVLETPARVTTPTAVLRMGSSLLGPGRRERVPSADLARTVRLRYRHDPVQGTYVRTVERDWSEDTNAEGQVIEYDAPFLDADAAADFAVDFLAKRLRLAEESIRDVEVTLTHGAALTEGDLVLYDYAPYGLVLSPWRVRAVRKMLDRVGVDLVPYHPLADGYTPAAPPTEYTPPPDVIPPGSTVVEIVEEYNGNHLQVAVDGAYHTLLTLVITVASGNKLDVAGSARLSSLEESANVAVTARVRDTTSGASTTLSQTAGYGIEISGTLKQSGVTVGAHTIVLEVMGTGDVAYGLASYRRLKAIESTP